MSDPNQSDPPKSPESPPFSKSADKNKDHILAQLKACLQSGNSVLEIASGTGQHALHFSNEMPQVTWQCSDLDLSSFGLEETIKQSNAKNLPDPLILDIDNWPVLDLLFDAVFSANCIHIISEQLLGPYVAGVARSLRAGGLMLLYGPYKYDGAFTTPSNQDFDGFLRATYAGGGIKDFEVLENLANQHGLKLQKDVSMPANNQFLIWRRLD